MRFLNIPADAEGSARPAIIMGIFVAFGGILFGYDTGTIGGILAMGERVDRHPSI
jgi:SP family sugar:H+ symporter-like MFS transporter